MSTFGFGRRLVLCFFAQVRFGMKNRKKGRKMGLWDGKKRVFVSVGGQGMALSASWGSFWGQNRAKLMVRGQIKGPERVLNRQKGCLGQSAASLGSDQELQSSESVHFGPSEALLRTLRPFLTICSRKNSPTSAAWTISGPFCSL